MMNYLVLLVISISLLSCTIDQKGSEKTIIILPTQDVSLQKAELLASGIRKYYPRVIIESPITIPQRMLNTSRSRYRADSIIKYYHRIADNDKQYMIITTQDISTTLGSKSDWGVMGLGINPGKACITSSYRLKGNNVMDKWVLLSLHELAHTEGLPHCKQQYCIMEDAEGKDKWDTNKAFCATCKSYLKDAGWSYK